MSRGHRLVVFDVDGTLVDSQADIVTSMEAAFACVGSPTPARSAILEIVGLSLPQAMARLAPDAADDDHARMVAAYKSAYMAARRDNGTPASSPLYPGARDILDQLAGMSDLVLGIATGKSRRGLDHLLDAYDLHRHFVTTQVADFHPSKPHPAMLQAALDDAGVTPDRAVMIGDTEYDLGMAQAANVPFIAVSWGYHAPARLQAATARIDSFAQLPRTLERIWSEAVA